MASVAPRWLATAHSRHRQPQTSKSTSVLLTMSSPSFLPTIPKQIWITLYYRVVFPFLVVVWLTSSLTWHTNIEPECIPELVYSYVSFALLWTIDALFHNPFVRLLAILWTGAMVALAMHIKPWRIRGNRCSCCGQEQLDALQTQQLKVWKKWYDAQQQELLSASDEDMY